MASWSRIYGPAILLVTDQIRQPITDLTAVAERVCRFFVGAFD